MTSRRGWTSLLASSVVFLLAFVACGGDEGSVSFAEPSDGDAVSSPVQVEMQADNFIIEEAGEVRENAGHFHVVVDAGCVSEGETIPEDDSHIHFGDASTSGEVELEPGEHDLCLQVGDGEHTALDLTDEITVEVTE